MWCAKNACYSLSLSRPRLLEEMEFHLCYRSTSYSLRPDVEHLISRNKKNGSFGINSFCSLESIVRKSRDSAVKPVLKRPHMKQPERLRQLILRMPRSLWKSFSVAADWTLSSVSRAVVWLTESNSIPRKEILCTGESLLFSQLTWSPNRLRWRSTMSLYLHNWSRDCASICQSSR